MLVLLHYISTGKETGESKLIDEGPACTIARPTNKTPDTRIAIRINTFLLNILVSMLLCSI
jgi:hypothetical protein